MLLYLAANAANCQYTSDCQPPPDLPFTGSAFALWGYFVVGLTLLIGGLLIRRSR